MNTSVLLFLAACVIAANGYRIQKTKSRKVDYFIGYISENARARAPALTEQVTLLDQEVRLVSENGISVVLDYGQMMLFAKRSGSEGYCVATSISGIKRIPSLGALKAALRGNRQLFKMPTDKLTLDLQKSQKQFRPELSPLAEELCGDYTINIMEQKPASPKDYGLRPKRDIGWGEVALIVLVIILL